jgi:hypothetical protein
MVLSAREAVVRGTAVLFLAAPGCVKMERMEGAVQSSLHTSVHNCDLRVSVQAGPGKLSLGYEFRNGSARTAFLFNVLHRPGTSGGPQTHSNLVYVLESGGTLVLAKKVIPVPAEVDVEKPDVPYVTRVDPGQTFRERIDLPLPLQLWSPYPAAPVSRALEMDAWFELGFFLAPDPSVAQESGGNLIVYPFHAEQQEILRAGSLGRFPVAR